MKFSDMFIFSMIIFVSGCISLSFAIRLNMAWSSILIIIIGAAGLVADGYITSIQETKWIGDCYDWLY